MNTTRVPEPPPSRLRWFPRAAALATSSALLVATVAIPAFGASTGSTSLYTPQGSGTPRASGDYLTATTGLDGIYRYWIEVPSGLSRLRVQIFDADVGIGGAAEVAAQRDRARNAFNTTANYTLIDPSGTARPTQFTSGTATAPTGADNAWLTFYDGSGTHTVRDNFSASSYANNDGTDNWATNWVETGDDGTTTGGEIQINANTLRIGHGGGTPSITREANLSGSGLNLVTAYFSFTFTGSGNAGDTIAAEVYNGTSFRTLEILTGTDSGSRDYPITSDINLHTQVRFRVTAGLPSNRTRYFNFDNVQIHDGGTLTAGHWELRIDESSAATTGDDINAIGIRADDGDATSGGTEIPIYIDSMNEFGVNPPTTGQNTKTYDVYPYITSGCTAIANDFDYDSTQPDNVGNFVFTSRTGVATQTIINTSLSGNDVWADNTINSWTTDADGTDSGIFHLALTINSYDDATTGQNGNYTTFYIGNSSSAAPPPTANPQANAFRIYLPTDGGAAPVKPYLEQFVSYFSGPNPPTVGGTQRDVITVRMVNPTAKAITFSATNLVTVNVPGAPVLYAGTPQVSQGTVTAAPAIGGSGNITWNVGTLAAGATALLSYRVDITPTVAGQRIPAVGTVASGNGTRATYVDETGNTTQARATYTFGPICEVAVTQATLTPAVVSSFQTYPADGGTLVEWRTAAEAGTVGFNLFRKGGDGGWTKVNRELLAGLLTSPQGGTYRFLDPVASPREPQTYRLEEIDAKGRIRDLGPYTVRADWSRRPDELQLDDQGYARLAHATTSPATARPAAKAAALLPVLSIGPADALRVAVRDSGLYYLASSDLATRLGMTLAATEKALANGNLALSRAGRPVAWYPDFYDKGAKGLFFYGEAVDSLYTRDNIYRLERGNGLLMSTVQAEAAGGTAATAFTASLHGEQDRLPATVLSLNPASDYWFWDVAIAGDPTYGTRTFTLDAPGATTAGGAALTVHLQGATSTGVAAEHHLAVAVNGTPVGETHFQGITASDATFAVNPNLLTATGNQVQVTGLLDAGVPYSQVFIDSFDLSYPRTYRAAGDALAFSATAGSSVAAGGWSGATVRLLDVTDTTRPRWIAGAPVTPDPQGGFLVRFKGVSNRYFAAAPGGLKTPALSAFRAARLRSPSNQAEVVVIAGSGLHTAAQRLADYRTSQGLASMVVDFDEVTDEFAYGVPDPHALMSFLAYARASWKKAPRYLVLAGGGNVDYRNLFGYGDNLLPPLFVAAEGGLFPSDALLGDLSGTDGLPELAVGRIPARSAAELDAYVNKVIAYEAAAPGVWLGSVVALADTTDQGANFGTGSDRVAGLLPTGYNVDRIYLGSTPIVDARAHLLSDLNAGAAIVDYMGHGGIDRLSSDGLLTSDDVAALANGPRLPVVTAMTCNINRFAISGYPSLGELLVGQPGGGAIAVWAPSGLSVHFEAELLADRFYRHLGEATTVRLGDAVLRALRDFSAAGGTKSMIQIYNLLGDPTLRLRRPTVAPVGSTSTTRE